MCCIQPPPEFVSDTQIFARDTRDDRQFIVYQMKVESESEVAMTLPIPVVSKSAEDAVRFISLEGYPEFFADLRKGFPVKRKEGFGGGAGSFGGKKKLDVVDVGSFEASFVPTINDFDRLDERFRIPRQIWDKIRGYAEAGFVVFQLKLDHQLEHPMAFEFPRRTGLRNLFFPTVHIHDGDYHRNAEFDHELYAQIGSPFGHQNIMAWRESPGPASRFMDIDKASGIVSRQRHVYFKAIRGRQRNVDTWL